LSVGFSCNTKPEKAIFALYFEGKTQISSDLPTRSTITSNGQLSATIMHRGYKAHFEYPRRAKPLSWAVMWSRLPAQSAKISKEMAIFLLAVA
jgi:hypothetical protein